MQRSALVKNAATDMCRRIVLHGAVCDSQRAGTDFSDAATALVGKIKGCASIADGQPIDRDVEVSDDVEDAVVAASIPPHRQQVGARPVDRHYVNDVGQRPAEIDRAGYAA